MITSTAVEMLPPRLQMINSTAVAMFPPRLRPDLHGGGEFFTLISTSPSKLTASDGCVGAGVSLYFCMGAELHR